MNFPRFSGGKFISNCLSLSKHCCPQSPIMANHLITNPSDYKYRLEGILTTLPTTRYEMINWIQRYEFGDTQFYGSSANSWQQGLSAEISALVMQVLNAGMSVFLTAHGGDVSVKNLLRIHPDAVVVNLINHVNFSTISQKLKSTSSLTLDDYAGNYCKSKYEQLAGLDWPAWQDFEAAGYNIKQMPAYAPVADEIMQFYNWDGVNRLLTFDVDRSIFDKNLFLQSMEKLYQDLGFNDFNPELVGKFWQAYISLHVDTQDKSLYNF
jgi:hypothetical protein